MSSHTKTENGKAENTFRQTKRVKLNKDPISNLGNPAQVSQQLNGASAQASLNNTQEPIGNTAIGEIRNSNANSTEATQQSQDPSKLEYEGEFLPPPHESSTNSFINKCACKKSRCLKMYCICFARGELCDNCPCENCHNNDRLDQSSRQVRAQALKKEAPWRKVSNCVFDFYCSASPSSAHSHVYLHCCLSSKSVDAIASDLIASRSTASVLLRRNTAQNHAFAPFVSTQRLGTLHEH